MGKAKIAPIHGGPAEDGAASVRIELTEGSIKFWHGTAEPKVLLGEIKRARKGTWAEMWEFFRKLKGYQQLVDD